MIIIQIDTLDMHIVSPGLYKGRTLTLDDGQLKKSSEFPGRPHHQVEVGVQVDAGTDAAVVVQELLSRHLNKIFQSNDYDVTARPSRTTDKVNSLNILNGPEPPTT